MGRIYCPPAGSRYVPPMLPLIELGGLRTGSPLHLAPANSFPGASYTPALASLAVRHRLVSLALPGLGPDPGSAPLTPTSWSDLGERIAEAFAEHGLTEVIAVGHSFGAVASLVAAARHPERIRALCLLDPTMVNERQMDQIFFRDELGRRQHRLAVQARERRTHFASADEAYATWRSKRLFHDWSDELLRHFVSTALRPAGNGSGLTLIWPADWEAHYYEGFYYESWTELERLDLRIPVLVVRGGETDVFTLGSVERFRSIRPSATMVDVLGYGHLFPQAAPEQTGKVIREWLVRIDG